MTVCIAAVFNWSYPNGEVGKAIITASDRQITAGDIEYEPSQFKVCFIARKILILIAGDYTVHSEALILTQRYLAENPSEDVGEIAKTYAHFVRHVKYRHATDTFLAPLGLDHESFYAGQQTFSADFLTTLTSQLQSYEGPATAAIVAGVDQTTGQIYTVDDRSRVSCHTDVGFAAVGIGAWHAKSQLMQSRYVSTWPWVVALSMTYVAKKSAEIAPGVGSATDMFLITRDGWQPVLPELLAKVSELHEEFKKERDKLGIGAIAKLNEYLTKLGTEATNARLRGDEQS